MKKTTGLLAAMLAGSLLASADELVVQSFDSSGTLRFAEVTNAAMYRVEWASSARAVDQFWSSLTNGGLWYRLRDSLRANAVPRGLTFADRNGLRAKGSFIMGMRPTSCPARAVSEVPQHRLCECILHRAARSDLSGMDCATMGLNNGFNNSVGVGK